MKRKSVPPMSLQANQLVQSIRTLIENYEASLGGVPVWFEELEPDQALSLMAACLRIGLRLPPEETLHADMIERALAQRGIKLRGSTTGCWFYCSGSGICDSSLSGTPDTVVRNGQPMNEQRSVMHSCWSSRPGRVLKPDAG